LRKYFNSLDKKGTGSIGVDELEEPLISLGLAFNRRQVLELIMSVDMDKSGEIEFDEFLSILSGSDSNSTMATFFKNMVNGNLLETESNNIPFHLLISTYRRKQMLKAMYPESGLDRAEGDKIMKSVGMQIQS
jgi:centrin-1